MPQMSPLMWSPMLILFSILFIMFNLMNYFSFKNKKIKEMMHLNKNLPLNWKW
nr:ATP synthase F0 subunit 8 [Pielomastax soochowensis]